jgi:hypothetical protein
MDPIAISGQRDGEWSIVHRCEQCGVIKVNRIAGDDDSVVLICLALRPITNPPFPIEQIPAEAIARYRGEL